MTLLTDRSERVAEDPGPAAELAPMVEVWFRILADHVPDEDQLGLYRVRAGGLARWRLAEGARQWHASACPPAAGGCRPAARPPAAAAGAAPPAAGTAGVTWRRGPLEVPS
jgi:hypothetical protein